MNEKEFEKQQLEQLISDLKDIDKYTSFKNGAFIYDLGKYQGSLLVNHINNLQSKIDKAIEYINKHIRIDDEYPDYMEMLIEERDELLNILNDEVEIPDDEDEEKEIPEKLEEFGIQYNLGYVDYKNIETLKECLNKDFQTIYDTIDLIIKNQNKLIDYLKSKGE